MKLKYLSIAIASIASTASAASIVTSYGTVTGGNDGNQAGPMFGQGITVNNGADTADGSIPASVYLKDVTFQTTSSTTGLGTSTTAYIHVYDAFAVDGDNTPSTIGNLVTVSTNFIDLSSAVSNGALTWTFDGATAISKSTTYHYILASSTTAATVGDSSSLTTHAFELNTGNPYTGGQAFRANGPTNDWDMEFALTTDTVAVPEPSSVLLTLVAGLGLLIRRKR